MLFNSFEFLIFLPLVLGLFHASPKRGRNALLLAASYWFYGAWDARFLALLILSTGVDFFIARSIPGATLPRRKLLVTASIVVNLGVLSVFKYFDFFVGSLRDLLDAFGLSALDSLSLHLILPLGISFYTFQTMAYTIDVYRGQIRPCDSLLDYAVFVSYFPQLVAGPIERASRLIPQLQHHQRASLEMVRGGLCLMLGGFFKKVVIGDALVRPSVERAFEAPGEASGPLLLLGACLFSIQIYVDFSGYTDIARGTSRLLGIELMSNFEQPYLSRSITEFWRRWHISLSTWLRDYLYIPLGGNRQGRQRTYLNLMITMLLGGLWHGASWNFVIWGGLHGVFLGLHRVIRRAPSRPDHKAERARPLTGNPAALGGVLGTNLLVIAAWIFFRAPDLPSALAYFAGLADLFSNVANLGLGLSVLALYFAIIALLDAAPRWLGRHEVIEALPFWARSLAYSGLAWCIWTAWPSGESPFIYFQF